MDILALENPHHDENRKPSHAVPEPSSFRVSTLELPPLVPLAIPTFQQKKSQLRHARDPGFSRPYGLAILVLPKAPHNARRFYTSSQEIHMEEINSLLYDMHGTAHVILIFALFVILLIAH